jgi:hypothetical protein
MEGYLGKLEPLKDRLVDAIGRDEDIEELKREYQEILRFKQYVDFLRQGEKSEFWKRMYTKSHASGLTSDDAIAIRRNM